MKADGSLHTVFVCVPSPNPDDGAEARRDTYYRGQMACHLLTKLGYLPLCPMMYFSHFLSQKHSPDVEDMAVLSGEWLAQSQELWCFGDMRTEEMERDIKRAKDFGLTIRYCSEPDEMRVQLLDALECKREEKR